ncbi:hypothetical protein L2E82_18516 [Cichorium intybus]|uniref:Uncharacterized protein n=1 Tax=Cichorium intybus TaxID=13427 RepID=A0ACB9F9T8_CICIN|nr:hypothetical protein L2E82_18516 [Cichorium intybus]
MVGLHSILTLQEQTYISLQATGRTIFGRIFSMLSFPSNAKKSAHSDSKLSRNNKGNSTDAGDTIRIYNKNFTVPIPRLQASKFDDSTDAGDTIRIDNKNFNIPIPRLQASKFDDLEWRRMTTQANVARLRELSTLKGHVELVIKGKGLDTKRIQCHTI